jgi:hypothetical protein
LNGVRELKNPVFRNLIGKTSFHVFDWKGQMNHALNEEILGDAGLSNYQLDSVLLRLELSIGLF